MIIPQNRLLLMVGSVLPFLALAAVTSANFYLSYGLIAAIVGTAMVDLWISRETFKGLSVKLPEILRFSKDREAKIPITIQNSSLKSRVLQIGLLLHPSLRSSQEHLSIILPDQILHSQIPWKCTPSQRGNFSLKSCYLETRSFLGFWCLRTRVASTSEIRVYPDLHHERKSLASIFLNRGNFGSHTKRLIGQGREFEKLRDYVSGDSYDQIHWKATAKRGRPVTKVFQIERTQEVYVVIDSSRLSGKKIGSDVSLERFITASLIVGLVAEQQGDLFGLISFSDQVKDFIRAKSGKAHYHVCRDALYRLQSKRVIPNFEEVCSFIRLRLRRRALIIFLTDLNDPDVIDHLGKNLDLICRQHLVLIATLKSPVAQPLFHKQEARHADEIYQYLGGHLVWHQLQELERKLYHHGVKLLQIENDNLSSELVSQYLKIKGRQLL
jgi:uncharacterized protein (DUF58 family)